MNKTERIAHLYLAMSRARFTVTETSVLLRCSRALHRWAELECGTDAGHVERDDSGKPFFVSARSRFVDPKDPRSRRPIPDREASALRKVAGVLKSHPGLTHCHQTDPRGCALHILRPGDVPEGADPSAHYTRGIAVCL